jgi:PAS domain S-box-containing protein
MSRDTALASNAARILIVDDECHNRRLLEVMLAPENFQLRLVTNGDEALAMVAKQPPDLILLDVMMPGLDGYEVARRVKENVATRHIPIIMLTALDTQGARMSGLDAGAEDFLTKPVDRAELRVRVRNLLRLKAHGDDREKYSQVLEGDLAVRTSDLAERTKCVVRQDAVLTGQAALLELAQDAIMVRDMDGRITFWSHGAEAMYGWRSDEAVGRPVSELLRTEPCEPTEDIETRIRQEGQWAGEATQHGRDGLRRIVASRSALQFDADGEPFRILTIDEDLTDRKQADSELLALTELEESRKDQLRFKDEFLSHVSHELRSPLTAIKQFTTILLSGVAGPLNHDQRKYQTIVLRNIQQLQAMIDDLLEVTRLETGKLTVEPESVSVPDAVADSLDTLEVTARAKGVAVSCHLPPDLPSVYADPTRLRQIMIILLDNAIKFTAAGGAVSVDAHLIEPDRQFLQIEVSDTGCGISPEGTERIFERLFQSPAANLSSRNGLGLGLYICKELVTRQGGEIRVDSQQKRGSSFSFTLPVFSLDSLIAPLLHDGKWPAESAALLMVEMRLPGLWPSREAREEWRRDARGLLQRCLLPDLDVLLPTVTSCADAERFFVAAFSDARGATVLARRIREQFQRSSQLSKTDVACSVSYSILPPASPDDDPSTERLVASMAMNIEESIRARSIAEVVQ